MLSIVRLLPELFPKVFANGRCLSKELAESYLRHCPHNTRADKDAKTFLGTLSPALKLDRDLILMTLKKFGILRLPDELRGNRGFALAVAKQGVLKVGDRLQLFTSRVRSNYDVALAFCQGNASSYLHVQVDARKKYRKLAEIACLKCPDLLLTTVPGIIERQLIRDEDFILSLLRERNGAIPYVVPDFVTRIEAKSGHYRSFHGKRNFALGPSSQTSTGLCSREIDEVYVICPGDLGWLACKD